MHLEIIAHRSTGLHGILFQSVWFQIMSTLNLELLGRKMKKKVRKGQNCGHTILRTLSTLFSTCTRWLKLKAQTHISKGKTNLLASVLIHIPFFLNCHMIERRPSAKQHPKDSIGTCGPERWKAKRVHPRDQLQVSFSANKKWSSRSLPSFNHRARSKQTGEGSGSHHLKPGEEKKISLNLDQSSSKPSLRFS